MMGVLCATRLPRPHSHSYSLLKFRFTTNDFYKTSLLSRRPRTPFAASATPSSAPPETFDILIVGAGVIGLASALTILRNDEDISVGIIERSGALCAEATGAGQGYLWMAHRNPAEACMWQLALHGKDLWQRQVDDMGRELAAELLGFQANGSLLVARGEQATATLTARKTSLAEHGINANLLTEAEALSLVPSMALPPGSAALSLPSDIQVDGRRVAAWLLQECQSLGHRNGKDRFQIQFNCNVERILMECCFTTIEGVSTSLGVRKCRMALVLAAGAWASTLIKKSFYDNYYADLLMPRSGHLLELPYPSTMQPLSCGVMDASYARHYSASGQKATGGTESCSTELDDLVTFTACTSHTGTLLLGSSRQDNVYDNTPNDDIVLAILREACAWMPDLKPFLSTRRDEVQVRVGPRPASKRGKPYIGLVPGLSGLVLAAGHEGSGLTMALSTAEIVSHLVGVGGSAKLADCFQILGSQEV